VPRLFAGLSFVRGVALNSLNSPAQAAAVPGTPSSSSASETIDATFTAFGRSMPSWSSAFPGEP
jgi:hypothetical protein